MSILDIILIIVITLYAFIHGCKIAYEKGVEDGRESGCLRQLLRDIDFINKLKGKHIIMKITELKIGDKVCNPSDGFPMIVVGLNSSLDDLNNGTVYLDFEGNEGDRWEEEAKNLIPYQK